MGLGAPPLVLLLRALLLAAAAVGARGSFDPPPGCSWVAALPGGNGEGGACSGDSDAKQCKRGEDFVGTHSLACSPPPGVAVKPELFVFTPGGAPANYSLLVSTVASWGYRAIAIDFNNIDAPNSICDGGPGHAG